MNVLNFSGGKDSTAMLLKLIDLDMRPNKIVFADTLMEFPEMYDYIDKVEAYIGQDIIRLQPKQKHQWDEFFYGTWTKGKYEGLIRGFPYVCGKGQKCWHKRNAKTNLLDRFNKKADQVYIGYAFDEPKRSVKGEKYCYPLRDLAMTENDCTKYCEKHNLLNPLYRKGFTRLGCWTCPWQGKQDLKILKRDYPTLWNRLLQYEKDSPQGFKPDFKLKNLRGDSVDSSHS